MIIKLYLYIFTPSNNKKSNLKNVEIMEALKQTLQVSRGKRSRYYISIEFKGERYGVGFDDAHLWDALNDLEDTSFYDDVKLTAVEKIVRHHDLDA